MKTACILLSLGILAVSSSLFGSTTLCIGVQNTIESDSFTGTLIFCDAPEATGLNDALAGSGMLVSWDLSETAFGPYFTKQIGPLQVQEPWTPGKPVSFYWIPEGIDNSYSDYYVFNPTEEDLKGEFPMVLPGNSQTVFWNLTTDQFTKVVVARKNIEVDLSAAPVFEDAEVLVTEKKTEETSVLIEENEGAGLAKPDEQGASSDSTPVDPSDLPEGVPGVLLVNLVQNADGNYENWLGSINLESFPWVYTEAHGWWFVGNKSNDFELYAFSQDLGWMLTSPESFPGLYFYKFASWFDAESSLSEDGSEQVRYKDNNSGLVLELLD